MNSKRILSMIGAAAVAASMALSSLPVCAARTQNTQLLLNQAIADHGLATHSGMTGTFTAVPAVSVDTDYDPTYDPVYAIRNSQYTGDQGIYAAFQKDLDGDSQNEVIVFYRVYDISEKAQNMSLAGWTDWMAVYDYVNGKVKQSSQSQVGTTFDDHDAWFDNGQLVNQFYFKKTASGYDIVRSYVSNIYWSTEGIWYMLEAYRYSKNGNLAFNWGYTDGHTISADGLAYQSKRLEKAGLVTSAQDWRAANGVAVNGLLSPREENLEMFLFSAVTATPVTTRPANGDLSGNYTSAMAYAITDAADSLLTLPQ